MKFIKFSLITASLVLSFTTTSAQKAKRILTQSSLACQQIDSGYYELTELFKSMGGEDTFNTKMQCYFIQVPEDTIFGQHFAYTSNMNNKYKRGAVNTKDYFYTFSGDTIGSVYDKEKWGSYLQRAKHNYKTYQPFMPNGNSPFKDEKDTIIKDIAYKYAGKTYVEGTKCHKIIALIEYHQPDDAPSRTLRHEIHYYIDIKNSLLVHYDDWVDVFMNNDTMYQYHSYTLNKYNVNDSSVSDKINITFIPETVYLKNYTPYKPPKPLPVDTIAPKWNLKNLDGIPVILDSLKGKVVLIDFFYRSCYPCMLAIPDVQSIHEKYKDRGVIVLGIDPFDENTEEFRTFLEKRGVSYDILQGNPEVAKAYHMYGYPTLFIIGQDGQIIFVHEGYSEEMKEEIEKVLDEYLGIDDSL